MFLLWRLAEEDLIFPHHPCLGLPRKVMLTQLRERCREIWNLAMAVHPVSLETVTRLEASQKVGAQVTVSQACGSSGSSKYLVVVSYYVLASIVVRLFSSNMSFILT